MVQKIKIDMKKKRKTADFMIIFSSDLKVTEFHSESSALGFFPAVGTSSLEIAPSKISSLELLQALKAPSSSGILIFTPIKVMVNSDRIRYVYRSNKIQDNSINEHPNFGGRTRAICAICEILLTKDHAPRI